MADRKRYSISSLLPSKIHKLNAPGENAPETVRADAVLRVKKTGGMNSCSSNLAHKMRKPVSMGEPT